MPRVLSDTQKAAAKPCIAFDLTDPEQQRACFHYTNLQPLWWHQNLSKGGR